MVSSAAHPARAPPKAFSKIQEKKHPADVTAARQVAVTTKCAAAARRAGGIRTAAKSNKSL